MKRKLLQRSNTSGATTTESTVFSGLMRVCDISGKGQFNYLFDSGDQKAQRYVIYGEMEDIRQGDIVYFNSENLGTNLPVNLGTAVEIVIRAVVIQGSMSVLRPRRREYYGVSTR